MKIWVTASVNLERIVWSTVGVHYQSTLQVQLDAGFLMNVNAPVFHLNSRFSRPILFND